MAASTGIRRAFHSNATDIAETEHTVIFQGGMEIGGHPSTTEAGLKLHVSLSKISVVLQLHNGIQIVPMCIMCIGKMTQ